MTESCTKRRSFFQSSPYSADDYMKLQGKNLPVTYGQGYLLYWLLRGGIEDIDALSLATNIPLKAIQRVPLNELFVWFDDVLWGYDSPRRSLMPVSNGCRIYCQHCGQRLSRVPCECGFPASYGINAPDSASASSWHGWVERDDRHWKNQARIDEAEYDYNGDPLI